MVINNVGKPIILREADGLLRDLRPKYKDLHVEKNLKFFIIPGKEEHGEQPYMMWNGHKMRVRCEVILLDDDGNILIEPEPHFKRLGEIYPYSVAGGGIQKGETIEKAAARECKEESRIIPENIKFTGIHYIYEVPDKSKETWGTWGHISFVCVARKGPKFHGYIAPMDREDDFIKKMQWVNPTTIEIIPAHEEAIRWYKQYYYNPVLQESVNPSDYQVPKFLSGKDVYVNYDNWLSGKVDKLFIIGLSGSGKSTLGTKLAQQFNCFCVHTDRFRGNVHYTDEQLLKEDPLIYRYFDTVWGLKRRFEIKTMPKDERTKEFEKFIDWVLQQKGRIIIEGAVEKILLKNTNLQKYPIIFKGTSMAKSMFRMLKRELIEKPTFESAPISWILQFLTKYSDMRDLNNDARDSVMQHNPSYTKMDESTAIHLPYTFTHEEIQENTKGAGSKMKSLFESAAPEFRPMLYKPANFNEEVSKMVKDKYGNWKVKSPNSTYIGMDDKADEKKYLARVEFVKLKDDKYSAKPQPVIWFGDDDYRARCEVLIIRDNCVLLDRGKHRANMMYSLPGGGIDPKEDIARGAARECEEEANVVPKHIQYMNIAWREEYPKPKIYNSGAISFVCVAEYGREYTGKVAKEDKDEFADRAQWEEIDKANLSEPHKLAINRYRSQQHLKEEGIMDINRDFLDNDYIV